MRIGIDIDDTLTDIKDKLANAAFEYAKSLNKGVENKDLKINDVKNNGNIYQKIFDFTYEELKYSILLCYEDNDKFCHRHIVAEWINLLLDIEVPEVKIDKKGIEMVERPSYIRETLEEIMKANINMRGFNSIRAAYLFDESEKFEQKANKLEEAGKCGDRYRQIACFIRCDADEAECEYRMKKIKKQKVKR